MDIIKSTSLIKQFLQHNLLWDFLSADPNIYIGGSLPFMCLSPKISFVNELDVGDIDIYTTNCPLLFRNINRTFKITNIIKTGVNVKFDIQGGKNENSIPVQIITSPFEDFESEVLDEYDCGMVAVGFHPHSSQFVVHPRFTEQLKRGVFEVIHERSNPSRVKKLTDRASKLFDAKLIEIKLDSNTDYRPYWKNKQEICCLNDVLPSPPYTQLYANKYFCLGCKEKQDYLICKLCQVRVSNSFLNTIKSNNFASKYKRIVVFGGLNGLGKIMADEIIEITSNSVNLIRTGRNGGGETNTYPFDLTDYVWKFNCKDEILKNYDKYSDNKFKGKKIKDILNDDLWNNNKLNPELINKIIKADLVIFNSYQTLEGDQSIWNTSLNTFDAKLSEKRFKINCWGYVGLIQEILNERKKFIQSRLEFEYVGDQIFVWIDANESRFDGKLSDGKHLELNMAKTACKQIFYTNANVMAGLGILFLCYDCGWCSYHGISVDKIASKSTYLVNPKLTSNALIAYLSTLDIDELYEEKKFIHDMTFYKCVENIDIDLKKNITHDELDFIVKQQVNQTINIKLEELNKTKSLLNDYMFEYVEDKIILKNIKLKNNEYDMENEDEEPMTLDEKKEYEKKYCNKSKSNSDDEDEENKEDEYEEYEEKPKKVKQLKK